MVNLIAFDTEEELMELTGLSEDELWEKKISFIARGCVIRGRGAF